MNVYLDSNAGEEISRSSMVDIPVNCKMSKGAVTCDFAKVVRISYRYMVIEDPSILKQYKLVLQVI